MLRVGSCDRIHKVSLVAHCVMAIPMLSQSPAICSQFVWHNACDSSNMPQYGWQKVSPWTPSHDLQDWPSGRQSNLQHAKHPFFGSTPGCPNSSTVILQKMFLINNYWTCKLTVAYCFVKKIHWFTFLFCIAYIYFFPLSANYSRCFVHKIFSLSD